MAGVAGTPAVAMSTARPRLGFLGVGWIGRHRIQAILEADVADAVAVADPSAEIAAVAGELAPGAAVVRSLDDLLAAGVDGVVIATPSALHAEQAICALRAGAAVFCQKPLGRTAAEVGAVIEAARAADRLLGVDMSYRCTAAMQQIHTIASSGGIGRVFAADLVFHNAYGPDKAWFYDAALSGGGCVMDLGIHLIDLALWVLDFPEVQGVSSRLFSGGQPMLRGGEGVEDFATATLDLADGCTVRLTCSWRLQAGRDAVISASFFGTEGGLAMRNVDGSFYDLMAERYKGTATETLTTPPDLWGGRAAAAWAFRLAAGARFDPEVAQLRDIASVIDRIYGGANGHRGAEQSG